MSFNNKQLITQWFTVELKVIIRLNILGKG